MLLQYATIVKIGSKIEIDPLLPIFGTKREIQNNKFDRYILDDVAALIYSLNDVVSLNIPLYLEFRYFRYFTDILDDVADEFQEGFICLYGRSAK